MVGPFSRRQQPSDVRGDPSFAANAINQRPAVYFDGDDYMAITQDIGRVIQFLS